MATNSKNKVTYKLNDKDFKQMNIRNILFNQVGWNYERMQGSSYLYLILPQLRKMYGDHTPELKKMMKMQNQFFNTSNFFNTIIEGIDMALEEKEGVDSLETVAGIKAGLMGPFAAIGDSIFAALVPQLWVRLLRIWRFKEMPLAQSYGCWLTSSSCGSGGFN